jgi:glycosyltransferase involved in cell wall biosynthesis
MAPLVTVFTSCHNGAQYLKEAIESVIWQTYPNFEYLLYDDGSSDDTLDIMRYYSKLDDRIKVKSLPKQKNVGVVINQSFRDANGKYWVWCPSDDVLVDTLLEMKVKVAASYPDAVLYNNWIVMDEHGKLIHPVEVPLMTPDKFAEEVWRSSPIGFTGIWIPLHIVRNMDLEFPEHLHFSEDFYWMIKATIHGVDFVGVNHKLHYKRKHLDATTARNIDAILDQIPRIRSELREYKEWLIRSKSNVDT